MLDVFLCHGASGREIAEQIAGRLERCAEAKVWLDEVGTGDTVLDAWEAGTSSSAIVLLLHPDVVPQKVTREQWQPVLDHVFHNSHPPLACVRAKECAYPSLLERNRFFPWPTDPLATLRGIEEWVIGLHEQRVSRPFAPARLPWFQGRQREMENLWSLLVDGGGASLTLLSALPMGKTALAQEFSRSAVAHFRDVIWIPCGDRSMTTIAEDLAGQLGSASDINIPAILCQHRLLVVFDDLRASLPFEIPEEIRSSVLVTTRDRDVAFGAICELEDPPPDQELRAPENVADIQLWRTMAVCRVGAFPTSLAAAIVGEEAAKEGLGRLFSAGLADPLDATRARLNATSRDTALKMGDVAGFQRKHAEHIRRCFVNSSLDRQDLAGEVASALRFLCENDWPSAKELAQHASDFLRRGQRPAMAAEVLHIALSHAEAVHDGEAAGIYEWELSWIQTGDRQIRRPMQPAEQLQLGF